MPHEVDMTKALIMSLRDWWLDNAEGRAVKEVILQVGAFTCVEPDLLITSFDEQREEESFLKTAQLSVKDIPFIAFCSDCKEEYQPDLGLEYACPKCSRALHDIRSGRELKIERVIWA